MAAPGIIVGRNILAPEGFPNEVEGRFFSSFPGSTPKFAMNQAPRRSEFTETMARFIVDIPQGRRETLLQSLPGDTAAAAQTLLYSGDLTSFRTASGNSQEYGAGYFDFLLTQVSLQRQEREQVVDTLTDNTVIFYSGESAPLVQGSGVFLNTFQDDQNVWFSLVYTDLLRGTQLARRGLVARFRYDSFFLTGYLTGLATSLEGTAKNYVNFSFTFRVKQIQLATPIIYSPSTALSLLTSNIFAAYGLRGADDKTRRGAESAEKPLSPRAKPAASTGVGVDPRAATLTDGIPPREQQAAIDRALTSQLTAAAAQLPSGTGLVALNAASAAVASASGDVRQKLPASEAQLFQDFRTTVPTPQASPNDPLAQLDLAIAAQLRSADARGTALVSPVAGTVQRSGTYADTIARAPTTAVTTDVLEGTPASSPGAAAAPVRDAASEELLDVYRPPPQLLAELVSGGSTGTKPREVAPRSRGRATG